MIESVIAFINEIESHCYSQAIATFLPSNDQPFVIDLVRKGQKVKYGYRSGMREKFIKKLISECQPIGTLVLRSFTAEIDEITKLPIKELRGYIIDSDGQNWQYPLQRCLLLKIPIIVRVNRSPWNNLCDTAKMVVI
jgi:hypothetical protein